MTVTLNNSKPNKNNNIPNSSKNYYKTTNYPAREFIVAAMSLVRALAPTRSPNELNVDFVVPGGVDVFCCPILLICHYNCNWNEISIITKFLTHYRAP